MFFCQDKRPEFAAANPNAAFAELGKILGSAWSALSPSEKKPYEDQNEKDKQRYADEKANAPDDDGDDGGSKKKKQKTGGEKKKKDKNAPKSAPSAYVLFCQEERPKLTKANPNLSFGELGTQLGAAWKALSEDEKQPFNDKHKQLKKEADAKKAAYEAEHGPIEKKKKTKKSGDGEKKKKKKKAASDDEGDDDDGGDD